MEPLPRLQMVPTDDGALILIPAIYGDFVKASHKAKAKTLLPHLAIDHAIDLPPGYNLPYGRIKIERS
jgi:hypothetical protein